MQKTQPLALAAAPTLAAPRLNLVGSLLLALLMTALVALGAGVAARVLPGWRPGLLVAACLLVAVEAALVRYRMLRGRHLAVGALPYLGAELFALTVLMRVAATLSADLAAFQTQLGVWVRAPLAALDTIFFVYLGAGLLVALCVRGGLRALAELEPGPGSAVTGDGLDDDFFRASAARHERAAMARLASGLGWGGLLALLALVAQVINVEQLGGPALPLAPSAGLAGLLYLICAVLLYSRARLGLLRARWQRDETLVEPAVLGRWRAASVTLVLAVAGLGLLLPRGYGAGIFDAVRSLSITLLNLLSLTALFFAALAMGALGLALTIPALIIALLTGGPGPSAPAVPLVPPPLAPPVPPTAPGEAPLAPGLIFWACIAILAAYALWTVLRRQDWALAAVARLRAGLLAPLRAWLVRLWAGAADYARKVSDVIAEHRRVAARRPSLPPRPRLRELGPAGLVRWLYAAMLARAAQGGLERRRAETPYEYGAQLRTQLPDAADEIERLTDAYVAAAYAPRPTTPEQAGAARRVWSRLRRALRTYHHRDTERTEKR